MRNRADELRTKIEKRQFNADIVASHNFYLKRVHETAKNTLIQPNYQRKKIINAYSVISYNNLKDSYMAFCKKARLSMHCRLTREKHDLHFSEKRGKIRKRIFSDSKKNISTKKIM